MGKTSVVASLTSSSSSSWSTANLLLLSLPADPESLSEFGGVGLRIPNMLPMPLGENCLQIFGWRLPGPLIVQAPTLLFFTSGVFKTPADARASLWKGVILLSFTCFNTSADLGIRVFGCFCVIGCFGLTGCFGLIGCFGLGFATGFWDPCDLFEPFDLSEVIVSNDKSSSSSSEKWSSPNASNFLALSTFFFSSSNSSW